MCFHKPLTPKTAWPATSTAGPRMRTHQEQDISSVGFLNGHVWAQRLGDVVKIDAVLNQRLRTAARLHP